MKVCAQRFNIYLALAAFVLLCGCQTGSRDKKDQELAALRVHLQVPPASASQTITVLRNTPVLVNVTRDPILTEVSILAARVIDAPGGFAIQIKFNESASWLLEQYSASNPGKHLAVFGQWGDKLVNGRWLAAPIINHRIADGILAFTPDCSREEADQLVMGLNNAGKKSRKGSLK